SPRGDSFGRSRIAPAGIANPWVMCMAAFHVNRRPSRRSGDLASLVTVVHSHSLRLYPPRGGWPSCPRAAQHAINSRIRHLPDHCTDWDDDVPLTAQVHGSAGIYRTMEQ